MNEAGGGADEVAGERAAALVHRLRGLQSRLGNVLALGLMLALGGAALSAYYVHVWHGRRDAPSAARRAQAADLPLPALGPIDPPAPTASADGPVAAPAILPAPAPLVEAPAPEPLSAEPAADGGGGLPRQSAAQRKLERRLAGPAFVGATGATGATGAAASASGPMLEDRSGHSTASDALQALMQPTVTAPVRARRLPTMRLLLPKGAFIDCTLETAIDSTLPGLTTCITATDTFGADGEVVLLERGTKLVGEVRGQVRQGMARVFVLWTEARTPDGIVVPLDSPGTDELGRAGLPGRVNRHFWQRFGAAMLVSIIDAGTQAGVQAANNGGGTVVVNPSAGEDVMTEALRGTIDIAPTIVKRQGDRIQVLVARDLDFRSVYALRVADRGSRR
ncbi:MAG TPA: type IV secretion system protein VirB10 [Steroidobacteraceae bacterium]|nr:type IV secretion system protein VirB10 [Steroidobacteraceae bacterium]